MSPNSGKALIEDGSIVIRVPLHVLQTVVDGAWVLASLDKRYLLTDIPAFAKEFINQLNDEDEEGTTAIHKMFDRCIERAIDQGAEGIEEDPEQFI